MEKIIDLDEAAAVLTARVPRWRAAGLDVGPLTWRDARGSWPWRFETDRTVVADPDSVGVEIRGAGLSELSVVLFRGGWADVWFIDLSEDHGPLPASDIETPVDFAGRLDAWVTRVFGPSGG